MLLSKIVKSLSLKQRLPIDWAMLSLLQLLFWLSYAQLKFSKGKNAEIVDDDKILDENAEQPVNDVNIIPVEEEKVVSED